MKKSVEPCIGKLIVSCQAYEDTPFYGPDNIKRFVESAMIGGASAVRCCWPQDIRAARSLGDITIIGINKVFKHGNDMSDIFITPTFETAEEIIEAGCDIVALDARITDKRGKEQLLHLFEQIHDKYPEIGVMVDCATLEEGVFCAESGYVDIVSTTLSGLVHPEMEGPDVELVRAYKKSFNVPVNAEGRIWELNDVNLVHQAGADMITIGTAITRPHLITQRFIDYYKHISD